MEKDKIAYKYILKLVQNINADEEENNILEEYFKQIISNITYNVNINMSEMEAEYFVYYLSQRYIEALVKFEVEKPLILKFENLPKNVGAFINFSFDEKDNYNNLVLSNSLKAKLVYGDLKDIEIVISVLYHELTHYNQYIKMTKKSLEKFQIEDLKEMKKTYQLAIDAIGNLIIKDYYIQNYEKSFCENDADIESILLTDDCMNKYFSKYYFKSKKEINLEIKNLKQKYYTDDCYIYGHVLKNQIDVVNSIIVKLIEENEINFVKKYSILDLAFEKNGIKKTIDQIFEERNEMIELLGQEKSKEINDLYLLVYNSITGSKTSLLECIDLIKYIESQKKDDKFLLGILKYKLSSLNKIEMKILKDMTNLNLIKNKKI